MAVIPKIMKQCPCCFQQIANDEVEFLIRDNSISFHSPILDDLVIPRQDEKYVRFWNNMGNQINIAYSNRILISNQDINEKNEELLQSSQELIERTGDENSYGYRLQIREDSTTISTQTVVCPHCHNVLPQNFFKYPMIFIGLAGSVATGKTVFLCSLIMNSFRVLNKKHISVRNAHGNPLDPEKIELEKMAEKLFKEGICPDSTSKSFNQPVYLEVSYDFFGEKKTVLVTLYDVAGETIRKEAGTGKTIYAAHLDGVLFLVDPSQMSLEKPVIPGQVLDEEKILRSCRILSKEEQISIQKISNEKDKEVFPPEFSMELSKEQEAYMHERNPETVLESIRMGIGDSMLSDKHIALTIAKCDQLEELEEFRKIPGSSILFDREDVEDGWLRTDRFLVRQRMLEKIFEEKISHLQRNVGEYASAGLFCISALGCDTKLEEQGQTTITKTEGALRPIRVEEPFLWLVMKTLQERGWL